MRGKFALRNAHISLYQMLDKLTCLRPHSWLSWKKWKGDLKLTLQFELKSSFKKLSRRKFRHCKLRRRMTFQPPRVSYQRAKPLRPNTMSLLLGIRTSRSLKPQLPLRNRLSLPNQELNVKMKQISLQLRWVRQKRLIRWSLKTSTTISTR